MVLKKKLYITIFSLLLLCTSVFARGNQDAPFEQIDACIQDTNYTDALKMLNEYIVENPKDFDNAQKRIDKIMQARTDYADLVEELIDVIVNEPTNDEKKLKMIAEVEAQEKNPNAATKAFIAQAKAAAEFTYFRSMFEQITAQGSEYTQNQKYYESLTKNQEGFALYRENFFEQGYDAVLVNKVQEEIALVDSKIKEFRTLEQTLREAYKAFNDATNENNISLAKQKFDELEKVVNQYADLRNGIAKVGWDFKSSFEGLQRQYPDLTEASFLAFAYRFVLGRESDVNSGMLVALDLLWNALLEEAKANVENQMEQNFIKTENVLVSFTSDFIANNSIAISDSLFVTNEYGNLATKLNAFYELLNKNAEEYKEPQYPEYIQKIADAKTIIDGFGLQIENCVAHSDLNDDFEKFTIITSDAAEIKKSNFYYPELFLSKIKNYNTVQNNFTQKYYDIKQAYASSTNFESTYKALERVYTENNSLITSRVQYSWQNLTSYLAVSSSEITDEYYASYYECNKMMETNPREVLVKVASILEKIYPTVSIFNNALTYCNDAPLAYENNKNAIQSNIARLESLNNQSLVVQSNANQRVLQAQMAQNEAELRYNQAIASLNKSDFTNAREYIDRSRAKFLESLSYQEDAELRRSSDEKLIALGEQILRAENELVVTEVRALKTRAKDAYYAGNFEAAESLLSQAKIRWATTNTEEDPEIVALVALVGTALSMKTGRTIPPTAPLYPEMSQILSIANQYFNDGKKLIESGNKRAGTTTLNNAKAKLRELKTVYPLNQEASLLTLRIDQLIDPAAFNESFVQKINNAKSNYKDSSQQQAVYAELLDLYEINPRYPGLKDFIYNVEIELGIRAKPVDNTAKRLAIQLTDEAKKLYDNNRQSEISLNVALSKVNEALEKDPDNTDAQILKDRISIALGGSGTVVLTAEAEQQYQQAVQELQRGNILSAYAIVSRLMENATYSKAVKVIDLMKRVEALL